MASDHNEGGEAEDTRELLRSAAAGNREAFGHVLARYRERLLSRVRMLLGAEARARADSGDFLQGVFVEALQTFDKRGLPAERYFLRWLTAVARNNVRDAVRRPRVLAFSSLSVELAASRGAGPASQLAHDEAQLHLLEELERLPEERRRVVELRSLDQLPFEEVARQIGRSSDAARMLHTRTLLQLAERLEASSR